MGACFESTTVNPCSTGELESSFLDIVDEARYEHGHGGYTGTFAEAPGLTVAGKLFSSRTEAEKWLIDNTEKWENAKAVKVSTEGSWFWLIGGWFSS